MACEIIQVAVEINRSKDRAVSVQMQNYKSSYHRWIISPDVPRAGCVEMLNDGRPFRDVTGADWDHRDQLERSAE